MRGEKWGRTPRHGSERPAVAIAWEQREAIPEGEGQANRQALESHCRMQAHIAQFYGVRLADLRNSIQSARKLASSRCRASGASDSLALSLSEISQGVRTKRGRLLLIRAVAALFSSR
jgi:hypothetical protein